MKQELKMPVKIEERNPLVNVRAVEQYGMPYSGNKFAAQYLIESGVARYYVLEYDICNTPAWYQRHADLKEEQKWHLVKLSHYLIDYVILIASGEARHYTYKSTGTDCELCKQYFKNANSDNSRENAAITFTLDFKSYGEAFYTLNHVFNQHAWIHGFGNWRWGNVTYTASLMYRALKQHDYKTLTEQLEILMMLHHNAGNALGTKFATLPVSPGWINAILWAKYYSQPCCIEWLRLITPDAIALTNLWQDRCTHTRKPERTVTQKPLYPGAITRIKHGNHDCAPEDYNFSSGCCKSFCKRCHTCLGCVEGVALVTACDLCAKAGRNIHMQYTCERWCKVCGICTDWDGHKICHWCGSKWCTCRLPYRLYDMAGLEDWIASLTPVQKAEFMHMYAPVKITTTLVVEDNERTDDNYVEEEPTEEEED